MQNKYFMSQQDSRNEESEVESCELEVKDGISVLVGPRNCKRKSSWKAMFLPHRTAMAKPKLLLSKGSVFVLGAILVVAAGVASQYHPPDNIINGNYSNCSSNFSTSQMLDPSAISGAHPTRTADSSYQDHTKFCSALSSSSLELKPTSSSSGSSINCSIDGIPIPSSVHQTIMSILSSSPLS